MKRPTLLAALALVGCSPKPPAPPEPAPGPAVVLAPEPAAGLPLVPTPEAPPAVPTAPEPPPEFRFTPDLTGPAVAKSVAPAVPLKLPTERKATESQPRPVPARYLDPDPTPRTVHALPPVPPAKAPATKPAPPAEKLPLAFGAGTERERVVLPVAALATARARDAATPPPPPLLGRQAGDRTPFDDPTGEVGNAAVVANAVPVPLGVSEFLKVVMPDPFELGAQVKPSVPPAAEPSAKPVEVSPGRVK